MTPPSPPEGRAETRARLEQLAADYVTETRPRRALPGADDYDWLLTALLRADAEQPRTPQPQAHAALVAFCESTAAGCRAEAQRCEVEAEMNRRDGSPLIASMYTRIAESARERAAKFDQLAALAAGASQATGGVALIAAERQRQTDVEGWTPEHDAEHTDAELVCAAICYAEAGSGFNLELSPSKTQETPFLWPWETAWWKPSDDPIRNLVKAGALIAAEIERLQRAQPAPAAEPEPNAGR
jgi:hypothetical protein